MTMQNTIADGIMSAFADTFHLYDRLDMGARCIDNEITMTSVTGLEILVEISTVGPYANVRTHSGGRLTQTAAFADTTPEGLVDTVVGYVARILLHHNIAAAAA